MNNLSPPPSSHLVVFVRHLNGEKLKDIAATDGISAARTSGKYISACRYLGYDHAYKYVCAYRYKIGISEKDALELARAAIRQKALTEDGTPEWMYCQIMLERINDRASEIKVMP